MEIINSFIEKLLSGQLEPIIIVALILTLLVVAYRWASIKNMWHEFRLRHAIKKLGKKSLRNVALSDGMDGLIHIEHLVLTPKSILMVYVRRFQGVIFAGDNIDMWTQVVDKGSFKFDNPLIQLDEDIVSISALLSGSDVSGLMVFTNESEFPKGKPDRVALLSDLKKKACKKSEVVSDKLQEDWESLVQAIK